MPTIYIDVLFFLNFLINITILNAETILLKIHIKPVRLIAGALLGALYSCLVFILDFKAFSEGISKILFAALMTWVSFGATRTRVLIKQTVALFVITVCMGMIIMCLLYFTDIGIRFGGIVRKGIFYFNIPLSFMIPLCFLATIIALQIRKTIENPIVTNCVTITVTHKKRKVSLTALSDTGNSLTDPISGRKVVIVEEKSMGILADDFDIHEISGDDFENLPSGFRLIPFSSIGKEKGLLPAFIPDKITVNGKEKNNLIVAIYKGTLSQTGDYNALISPCEPERKDVTYA